MIDAPERRDDPCWDLAGERWVKVLPEQGRWCIVLIGTGPDGEPDDDNFIVLSRDMAFQDAEMIASQIARLIGDALEFETRRSDAALVAADSLANRVRDLTQQTWMPVLRTLSSYRCIRTSGYLSEPLSNEVMEKILLNPDD